MTSAFGNFLRFYVQRTRQDKAEVSDLWSQMKEFDPEFDLSPTDKIPRKKVTQNLQAFLKHCCRERHYFFDIKKCGNAACTICKPPRLPSDLFSKLQHFPDPMPGQDGHYNIGVGTTGAPGAGVSV